MHLQKRHAVPNWFQYATLILGNLSIYPNAYVAFWVKILNSVTLSLKQLLRRRQIDLLLNLLTNSSMAPSIFFRSICERPRQNKGQSFWKRLVEWCHHSFSLVQHRGTVAKMYHDCTTVPSVCFNTNQTKPFSHHPPPPKLASQYSQVRGGGFSSKWKWLSKWAHNWDLDLWFQWKIRVQSLFESNGSTVLHWHASLVKWAIGSQCDRNAF